MTAMTYILSSVFTSVFSVHALAMIDYWWVIPVSLVMSFMLFYAFLRRREVAGEDIIPMSDEKVAYVIKALGGRKNINDFGITGSRVRFTLENVKAANLESLQDAGATGVFVAGNTVKCMFQEDPTNLVIALRENEKEI